MSAMHAAEGSATVIWFEGCHVPAGFTGRDMLELQRWDSGGRRVEIDPWADRTGQFAMIYEGDDPWASWAVSREGARILVWDCVSLADVGRFGSMRDALAALPGGVPAAASAPYVAEVISFSERLAQRTAA